LRIVLADVAGPGQVVSATALTLRNLLRKHHMDAVDQSLLMQEMNEAFRREDDPKEVQYAIAAVLGYCATGELIFTNAGHPLHRGVTPGRKPGIGFDGIARDAQGKERKIKHYYVQESVGIACGFLIAALHNMGLATLTHTPSPMGFLSQVLGRQANEKPFLLLPVGYSAEDAQVPEITKKPLSESAIFVE
jgi:hypothetical protein